MSQEFMDMLGQSTRRAIAGLIVGGAFLPILCVAQTPDREISVTEIDLAKATALSILETVDKAPLSKFESNSIYASAGDALKRRYTSDTFSDRVLKVRAPLGIKSERTFYGYSGPYRQIPNLIPGDYVIMAYRTRFAQSSQMFTEQITLEHDRRASSGWKFVEYYEAPIEQDGVNQ